MPVGRAIALGLVAVALVGANFVPPNSYIDPGQLQLLLASVLAIGAIAMALADRVTGRHLREWRNRLVLLAITLAIMSLIAEFGTRIVFRDVTTSSDNGGYFSRRWAKTDAVRVNSAGFRGRDYTVPKPAGVYRIAVVGDSFTYGNGIRQDDRYSELLQARLPSHFEVLNFGQPGANTPQHRLLVARLLREIQPDFVLLQWYVNDVEGDSSSGRPTFHSLMPIRSLHNWLNNNSALYTVANMRWAEMQVALRMTVSYTEYLNRRMGDANSRDSQSDRDNLNALISECQKAGVPVGIVLFPDTSGDMSEHYAFAYLHDRILDTCASHGITCLDLRKDFTAVHDNASLWANRLDHHPSARANMIAAERILQTFSPTWAGGSNK